MTRPAATSTSTRPVARKNFREVDTHAAAVNPVPETHRDQDAEQRAEPCRGAVTARVKGRQQENGRFQPFPKHRKEGHGDERTGRALSQSRAGYPLELPLQVARVAPHPDHHVGDHSDGDRTDDGLEPLLLPLRQIGGDDPQDDPDGQTDGQRGDDSHPHPAQGVRAAALLEEGSDDADDQCCFKALSQADDERGQHPE